MDCDGFGGARQHRPTTTPVAVLHGHKPKADMARAAAERGPRLRDAHNRWMGLDAHRAVSAAKRLAVRVRLYGDAQQCA